LRVCWGAFALLKRKERVMRNLKLEFLKETPEIVGRTPRFEWYLPTEVVVTKPKIVTPKTMRIWTTPYWYVEGVAISYEELRRRPDFKGTGNFPQRYIAELWEDHGDDGHVNFSLIGYVCGTLDEIKKLHRRVCWK